MGHGDSKMNGDGDAAPNETRESVRDNHDAEMDQEDQKQKQEFYNKVDQEEFF